MVDQTPRECNWTKREKEIILRVCRTVRKWVTSHGYGSAGFCGDASEKIKRLLKIRYGIKVKFRTGDFYAVDGVTEQGGYCWCGGHCWCEYKGIPFDVTADQFNLGPCINDKCTSQKFPAILVGRKWKHHYRRFGGRRIYT